MLNGRVREGWEGIEGRGGWVDSFFVGVYDDKEPAWWSLAASTGGEWFRIVQHVAEWCCEEERTEGKRRVVVKVSSDSAVPKWARKLIDDRQGDEPLVDEGRKSARAECTTTVVDR